jgi:hypothetical protein
MITRRSFFQFAVLAAAAGTAGLVTLAPATAEAREKVRDHRRRCRIVRLSDHHGGPVCR